MFKRILICVCLLLTFTKCYPTILKSIYLDAHQNIHIITDTGKDLQLTKDGKAMRPELSPKGETAAWLVKEMAEDDGASQLAVYQNDKVRFIECEPFIRQFWFALNEKGIAIDCGGSHFAGHEILYDIPTLKKVSSFDQSTVPPNDRPTWSSSSDHFDPAATSP